MKTIELPDYGVSTIVDDCDYDFVCSYALTLSGGGKRRYVYAYCAGMKDPVPIHRLIAARIGLDVSDDIDHRNQNKLDNRRSNLRPATRTQNFANRGKYRNNKSGFKNVFWSKQKQKWQGKVAKDRRQYHAGFHETPEEAYAACQKKAAELFGEFAST
jgi:hypothetical protein